MKKISFSALAVAVVLMVTAVSCTAVRNTEGYDDGYYSASPFYGSIDPFTGFYYNTMPYGYYSTPYVNGHYGARRYYNERPYNNGHVRSWNNNNQGRNWNAGSQQRTWNAGSQHQNRNEARTRVFGNHTR